MFTLTTGIKEHMNLPHRALRPPDPLVIADAHLCATIFAHAIGSQDTFNICLLSACALVKVLRGPNCVEEGMATILIIQIHTC